MSAENTIRVPTEGVDILGSEKPDTTGSSNYQNELLRNSVDELTSDTDISESPDNQYDLSKTSNERPSREFVVDLPDLNQLKKTAFKLSPEIVQEWEGYVTEIGEGYFVARLVDITAKSTIEEEEAEIPIQELSEADLDLLKLGGVFRWLIGYQKSSGGTKRRFSEIIFRRLPQWTKRDIEDAKKDALLMSNSIQWK